MAIEKKECTMCGKPKSSTQYYMSYSPLYKANGGRLTVCKDCITDLYENYLEEYGSETIALNKICNLFDTYYSEKAYNIAKQQNKRKVTSLVKTYFQKINSLAQFKGYTSKNSEGINLVEEISKVENIDAKNVSEEDIYGQQTLTKDIVKR